MRTRNQIRNAVQLIEDVDQKRLKAPRPPRQASSAATSLLVKEGPQVKRTKPTAAITTTDSSVNINNNSIAEVPKQNHSPDKPSTSTITSSTSSLAPSPSSRSTPNSLLKSYSREQQTPKDNHSHQKDDADKSTIGSKKTSECTTVATTITKAPATGTSMLKPNSPIETQPQKTVDKTLNVLIGVTGSVATIKLMELVQKIKSKFPRPYASKSTNTSGQARVNIRIVMTKNSQHFASKKELIKSLDDKAIEIYDDDDEWSGWNKIGDPVLHIELRKWADLMVIAPLDANTMAKLANGICDNLLTCTVRAWEVAKPLIYCPAMNVHMWEHPITREQLCKLQSFGYLRVDCVEKRLACGDVGMGAMAAVETIADKIVDRLLGPVAKKPALPTFVLSSQPTYPIMSTTGNQPEMQIGPPRSGIIINRLAPPCAPNRPPVASQFNKAPEISRLPRPHITIIRKPSANHVLTPGLITNGKSPQGVTSVNNIAALNMDCSGGDEPEDEEMSVEEDEDDDEQGFLDIDPTRMLEQSMTTGDDDLDIFSQRATINIPGNTSSAISLNQGMLMNHSSTSNSIKANGSGLSISGGYGSSGLSGCGHRDETSTPLFNTSKFLTTCYDAQRGCYTCKICKNHYKNRKSMARHLKEQHVQGDIYKCRPCDVSYKRREKLIKHYKERHPGVNIG